MSPHTPAKSIIVLLAVMALAFGCETLEDDIGNPEEGARVLSESAQCVSVNENAAATLACPDGQTISSVDFASYGTPAGTCDSGFTQSSCHASSSKSKVEGSCLGEPSCKLSATNGVFGDPCPGTYKRLSVLYTCSGGLQSGLLGTYFDNMNLTGQVLTRVDPVVNFDWGTGSPVPAIGRDTFSARWTGFVQAKFSQTYTFYTVSDDGIRLSVNDKLLIDNWTIHAPTENKGTIALQAGKSYSVKLEYYENGGGAVAKLLWSSPSQAKQVIPATQLGTSPRQEDLCPNDSKKTEPGLCGCGVPEGTCEPCASKLVGGQRLYRNQSICSPNGLYQFGLGADGDLVLSSGAEDLWSAGLCCDANTLNMQGDGNLVVRNNANAAKWNSKTFGNAGAVLTVENDGRAVIRLGNVELWSAKGKTTIDLCPSDPNKTQPGTCGCGTPDTDADGDGAADCKDSCPSDPKKTSPGVCGCGVPEGSCNSENNLSFPVRGAFYYPWYPQTWTVKGQHVFYDVDLGYYSSDDLSVIDEHIKMMEYANVDLAIASWWGPGTPTDERIRLLLERTIALGSSLKWAFYYEDEGFGNPSVATLSADLDYLQKTYGHSSVLARIDGRPLVFVYNADDKSCDVATRWTKAAGSDWYVSLKILSGFTGCKDQPDTWHQYGPDAPAQWHAGYSYVIAPGFWRADQNQPLLKRDVSRFYKNVRDMVASGEPWQLITTFNEWGEGTAVEPAAEWSSPTGFGQYLDALHTDGIEGDIKDNCPNDPGKIEPGKCGCGIPEGTCEPSDNSLAGDQRITRGEFLRSPNGQYRFGLDNQGDLVLLSGTKELWSAGLCCDAQYVFMQTDGNLVVRNGAMKALFNTQTAGNPGAILAVEDDGRAVIRRSSAVVWSVGGDEDDDNTGDPGDGGQDFFTIGFMPDTQYLVNDGETCKSTGLRGMFDYFVEREAELNIKAVAHVGDLTQGYQYNCGKTEESWCNVEAHWTRFMDGYSVLQNANMPFIPSRGNHDNREAFNRYFPVSDYETESFFGGYKDNLSNAYYLISAAGKDFIIMTIDYHQGGYPGGLVNWANDVLQEHSNRTAIVVTHDYRDILNNIVRQNDNVYMVMMGHSAHDKHYTQKSVGGKTQHVFTFDYQKNMPSDCHNAVVKYFTFRPSLKKVEMRTYSVHENRYFTKSDCYNNASGFRCQEYTFPF